MKNFHPFYIIGTVGMIVTSALHIFMSLGLSVSSAYAIFYALYSAFIAFIAIGFGLTIKKQNIAHASMDGDERDTIKD